jgi:hypothetical protein
MKEKISKNKWLFKQFTIINRTAMSVYNAVQGGVGMNFYGCYCEFEDGVFGWIKESKSFETALEIYEQYTSNDAWDTISQLEDIFGDDLKTISYEEISELEIELSEEVI